MKPVLEPEAPDLAGSFVVDDTPPLTVLGRSELERWATCPAQAALIESGRVNNNSLIAAAGEEVHQAFGGAIAEYIARRGFVKPAELADEVWHNLRCSRPDVQPEAIRGGRASVYAFAKFITSLHPDNITRFDGGAGDQSGVLAHDLPDLGIRLRGELDLLYATPSPEVYAVEDWKSGWRYYTAEQVAQSFQFCFYAALVLHNYEAINCVSVRIWNTRSNTQTYAVPFKREQLTELMVRIRSAAGEWWKWHGKPIETVPTWPSIEACRICPAAALCPASRHAGDVVRNPQLFVLQLHAMDAQLDAMKDLALAYTDEHGDIVTDGGIRFGREYPASDKRKPGKLYTVKEKESTQ